MMRLNSSLFPSLTEEKNLREQQKHRNFTNRKISVEVENSRIMNEVEKVTRTRREKKQLTEQKIEEEAKMFLRK